MLEPHPSRFRVDHPRRAEILAAHRAACVAGQAGYADPDTGLFVLTATFLAARGHCCGRGCRHCPYAGTPADRVASDDPGGVTRDRRGSADDAPGGSADDGPGGPAAPPGVEARAPAAKRAKRT